MFGTAGVRGSIEEVSPSIVLRIGRAVGTMTDSVVVGRDGRHTGGALVSAFVAGAESVGCDATFLGVVPTHVVAWKAREEGAYGVVITASHNPPGDNGVKLFRDDGSEFGAEDETEVERLVDGAETARWDGWTEAREGDAVDAYLDAVSDYFGDATLDLRVAVDCANGVGARTTVPALEGVGCDVVTVNAQTDPTFPGRGSKPTPETLSEFVDFVRRGGFDIGFAHDGDADRLVVVDGEGVVSEDAVLAVLAAQRVRGTEADMPMPTVLTTPNVSPRVDDAVREAGGDVERVALGTISEEARGRDVAFAAEPWKHVFPDFGGWVDGTVAAVEVACAYADDATVFDGMRDVDVTKESVACDDADKTAVMADVEERLCERYDDTEATFDTADGVRVDIDDGSWFLVRASGTEPLVRVYVEGDDELVETLVTLVEDAVRRV